jgi:radical SAM superfamily enzyme with C-terminal helix-hairpin-helix motif
MNQDVLGCRHLFSLPRYIYGGLISAGLSPESIDFQTIDHLKKQHTFLFAMTYENVFLTGGAVVPGNILVPELAL